MAQAVECLPYKHEALSLNSSTEIRVSCGKIPVFTLARKEKWQNKQTNKQKKNFH
jgi:hypothetical protein